MARQLRSIETPEGEVTYLLEHKRVKNLNLRLSGCGEVLVSVPMGCKAEYADRFVEQKVGWILKKQGQLHQKTSCEPAPELSREETVRRLGAAVERMFPLVKGWGIPQPAVKIRRMKSQWGNCHWAQGYITLNAALARCPEHLQDYVALHELVHFLHHDHGPEFYARMDLLMPDWRLRRGELKQFVGALIV